MNDSDKTKYFSKTKNNPDIVKQVFGTGSSGALAQRIASENPKLYRELKEDAARLGLIATAEPTLSPLQKLLARSAANASGSLTFSDDELKARVRWSKEDAEAILKAPSTGNVNNASNLHRDDPEAYALLKIAHQSYLGQHQGERPAESADFIGITPALAAKARLPEDAKLTVAQLDLVLKAVAIRETGGGQ